MKYKVTFFPQTQTCADKQTTDRQTDMHCHYIYIYHILNIIIFTILLVFGYRHNLQSSPSVQGNIRYSTIKQNLAVEANEKFAFIFFQRVTFLLIIIIDIVIIIIIIIILIIFVTQARSSMYSLPHAVASGCCR